MAAIPSTIVVLTEDRVHFPLKWVMVVVKQLFQYGVQEIKEKDGKVFIALSYTPRATTLKRKFGTLPVRYMRTKIDNQEDFKILEKVVKRYRFNLVDEEEDHPLRQPGRLDSRTWKGKRRVDAIDYGFEQDNRDNSLPILDNDEADDEDDDVTFNDGPSGSKIGKI